MIPYLLGSLERIDLREVWRNEATDFTSWLARPENLAKLSECLDLDLELDGIEVPIGPYRADLVATDPQTNTKVIVENQLEKTNHDHLGKIITYAAGLDACCVVWIAREFTEEHRKAMDYLNEKSISDMRFFGVEIQLFRIGDSLPAPFFRIIARPNEYASVVKNTTANEPSESKLLYYEFWNAFKSHCAKNKIKLKLRTPRHQHWYTIAIGKSYFHISLTASTQHQRIGCEIYIRGKHAKNYFTKLQTDQSSIEQITGPLEWQFLPDKQDCRIAIFQPHIDVTDQSIWNDAFEWLQTKAELFQVAFSGPIKKLSLDDG